MSWGLVGSFVLVTYLIRLTGFTLLVGREVPVCVTQGLAYVPAGLLAALIAVQTISTAGVYVLDSRVGGLVASLIAVALRAPFVAVFAVGVGVTAILRLIF